MAYMEKKEFKNLFAQANWYGTLKKQVKNAEFRAQFVAFVRTETFLETMKEAAKTKPGRANLAKSFNDDELRGILLKEYTYSSVRWAVGDLYNSSDGRKVFLNMFAPPSLSTPKAISDIIKAMTGTKLSREESIKDWKHYLKPEEELHATKADLDWFKGGLGSDKGLKTLLAEIKRDDGKARMAELLRTQEIRPALDEALTTKEGRARLAQLLNSAAGRGVLGKAMDTPEGINVVGYIWNMPDGKTMMSEKGNGIDPRTTALILYHQVAYNEKQDKLKSIPMRK